LNSLSHASARSDQSDSLIVSTQMPSLHFRQASGFDTIQRRGGGWQWTYSSVLDQGPASNTIYGWDGWYMVVCREKRREQSYNSSIQQILYTYPLYHPMFAQTRHLAYSSHAVLVSPAPNAIGGKVLRDNITYQVVLWSSPCSINRLRRLLLHLLPITLRRQAVMRSQLPVLANRWDKTFCQMASHIKGRFGILEARSNV